MKPTITSVQHTQPTAENNDGSIILSGLWTGTSYVVHFQKDGTDVTMANTSDEEGKLTLGGLTPGTYDKFYVVGPNIEGENNSSEVHEGGISLYVPVPENNVYPAPSEMLLQQAQQTTQGPGLTNLQKIKDLLYSYFANTHGGDPKQDVKNAGESLLADLKTLKGDQKETCDILKFLYPDIINTFGVQLEEIVTTMQQDFIARLGEADNASNGAELNPSGAAKK